MRHRAGCYASYTTARQAPPPRPLDCITWVENPAA